MKVLTKDVRIALVAIVGIVVLFFGMQFLKGLNLFSSADKYYVKFGDVSGLSASCPVYANGYKVGVVEQTGRGWFVKHKGVSGWYFGDLEVL